MKNEERIAKEYFEFQKYEDIVYEPNGNIPPDFVLNQNIAIEVRRLNQFSNSNNSMQPLEKLSYKLIPRLYNFIRNYKTDYHSISAFVSIYYRRPLKIDFKIMLQVKNILDKHSTIMESSVEYNLNEFLKLKIFPSNNRLEQQYSIGTITDNDSGGFVLSLLQKSIELILKEKEQKIKPYYENYKTWWLVLIDFIGYGLYQNGSTDIEQSIKSDIFDRIYLISPINPSIGTYI